MVTLNVIEKARNQGRTALTELESKDLIAMQGLPVVRTSMATSRSTAISLAKEIGFPIVLKVLSPDIIHKSDVGGVKVGLTSSAAVGRAYDEVMSSARTHAPQAQIQGVTVQKMARPGIEVILGVTRDSQFGPVLMFGLGGVMVEVLKDVAFRIPPLTRLDASQMIREIKGYPILQGVRGQPPVDIGALEDALLKLSGFVEEHSEIKELDLNPVFAYPYGILVADARVILESHA